MYPTTAKFDPDLMHTVKFLLLDNKDLGRNLVPGRPETQFNIVRAMFKGVLCVSEACE